MHNAFWKNKFSNSKPDNNPVKLAILTITGIYLSSCYFKSKAFQFSILFRMFWKNISCFFFQIRTCFWIILKPIHKVIFIIKKAKFWFIFTSTWTKVTTLVYSADFVLSFVRWFPLFRSKNFPGCIREIFTSFDVSFRFATVIVFEIYVTPKLGNHKNVQNFVRLNARSIVSNNW